MVEKRAGARSLTEHSDLPNDVYLVPRYRLLFLPFLLAALRFFLAVAETSFLARLVIGQSIWW
jgi:hypothetical protein